MFSEKFCNITVKHQSQITTQICTDVKEEEEGGALRLRCSITHMLEGESAFAEIIVTSIAQAYAKCVKVS